MLIKDKNIYIKCIYDIEKNNDNGKINEKYKIL